jgi:hypothetical protein
MGPAYSPIRRTSEYRALTEADALAQSGPDVAAAQQKGFVPIAQKWADDNGIKVLTVLYEQRGPDTSALYTSCPNCGQRLSDRGILLACPRCGYRMAPSHHALYGRVPTSSGPNALGVIGLALIVVFGSLWFLNNTKLGLELKCRYLSDIVACATVTVQGLSDSSAGGPAVAAPATGPDNRTGACAIQIRGYNATVVASADICSAFARAYQLPGDSWISVDGSIGAPAVDRLICTGTWDGATVTVWDSGGASFASQVCQMLRWQTLS